MNKRDYKVFLELPATVPGREPIEMSMNIQQPDYMAAREYLRKNWWGYTVVDIIEIMPAYTHNDTFIEFEVVA